MSTAVTPGKRTSRRDFETIAGWIGDGAHVLDLGCGDGSLLRHLRRVRRASGYGIEIDDNKVLASLKNGINVLQADLERGLSGFEDDSFDYVILSLTLQAVRHTERIVRDMLRVGREAIVTFPNFGYWRHRLHVMLGRVPVSRELPYQWYDTPNVHVLTIDDFEIFCAGHGMRVRQRVVLDEAGDEVKLLPNLLGALVVYRFDKWSA